MLWRCYRPCSRWDPLGAHSDDRTLVLPCTKTQFYSKDPSLVTLPSNALALPSNESLSTTFCPSFHLNRMLRVTDRMLPLASIKNFPDLSVASHYLHLSSPISCCLIIYFTRLIRRCRVSLICCSLQRGHAMCFDATEVSLRHLHNLGWSIP